MGGNQEARENREADFGVFVFSKDCAPEGLRPLTRRGNDIMVLWDHECRATDLAFTVALSMARALVTRQQLESAKTQVDFSELDDSIEQVEDAVSTFCDIRTWAGTISTNAGKIVKASEKAQADLEDQVKALNGHVAVLKEVMSKPTHDDGGLLLRAACRVRRRAGSPRSARLGFGFGPADRRAARDDKRPRRAW